MALTPTDLAYLAGLFDGEGSVLIYKRRGPINYPTGKGPRGGIGVTIPYQIRVTITNTNQQAVEDFRTAFGGVRLVYSPPAARRREAWKWTVQCQKAAAFLRAVLPYLRIKRLEAEIALSMQDTIDKFKHRSHPKGQFGQSPLPVEEIAYRDSLHARLQLVRRGVA